MNTPNVVSKTLDDLKRSAGLTGVDVANVADVSKATVSRWTSGHSSPRPETQLVLSDLRYVSDKLSEFYAPDEIRMWLYSRNNLLGGKCAIQLIHENRTEEVLAAIERLSSLTYV